MTNDIIEINDFVVLVATIDPNESQTAQCILNDDVIGITFYGSGDIQMDVSYGNSQQILNGRKGVAFSFFGNHNVRFSYKTSESEPLREVSIFSTIKNIQKLPSHEKELYVKHLSSLMAPKDDFDLGPRILMTPEMQIAISKIFNTQFQGTSRLLFLKSQVI